MVVCLGVFEGASGGVDSFLEGLTVCDDGAIRAMEVGVELEGCGDGDGLHCVG